MFALRVVRVPFSSRKSFSHSVAGDVVAVMSVGIFGAGFGVDDIPESVAFDADAGCELPH